MIKTVIFDIGNVLMKFEYMPYVRELLKEDALIEKVNDAIWRTGYWNELDRGENTEEIFRKMVAAAPDYEDAIRRTFENVGQCIHRMDYAIPWIKALRACGLQVLYLSNYAHHTMEVNPGVLDFLPYMDGGIFSCDEKVVKPDPEIFRRLCHRYRLDPAECVFLDDSETNVEVAAAFGMKALRFVSYAEGCSALERLLAEEGTPAPESRAGIWEHPVLRLFAQLNRYPRESGAEWPVSHWIRTWAIAHGIWVRQDEVGNLVLRKPASTDYGEHPAVMLQAHIDMVCEKNTDSKHDFRKDPIELAVDGEWLTAADGTTLGADNGIGVAAALAILEDEELAHPPLEVVFTVQEETTFIGAESVDVGDLLATRLINLDHADEHELIVGSCGGTGAELRMQIERAAAGQEPRTFHIALRGLKGGHSGEDIHRGRGNALLLMLRLLEELDLPVVDFRGGTNRLAIPREAEAVVLCADEEGLREAVARMEEIFRKEYFVTAPELTIEVMPLETQWRAPLSRESFQRLSALLRTYPNGILQMNGNLPGLVESSDNIGILEMDEAEVKLVSEARGAYQSTIEDAKRSIRAVAELFDAQVRFFDGYVPWEPVAESPLREKAVDTFREMYGEPMQELALHAGLECGFFAEKMPGLDIISIGPDCQYFHSPQERVRISSVERFYDFLKELLARL